MVKWKYKIKIPSLGSRVVERQNGVFEAFIDVEFVPTDKKGKTKKWTICEVIDITNDYLDSESEDVVRDLLSLKVRNLLVGIQKKYYDLEKPQSASDQRKFRELGNIFEESMPGFLEKWNKSTEILIDKIIAKMNKKSKSLINDTEETKRVMFATPPHFMGDREIWTYTQFKMNILKTSPRDFLNDKVFVKNSRPNTLGLTYLASFVERYLEEEDEERPGASHLKEILELLSEDLKKYQPLFYNKIKSYLDSEFLGQFVEPIFGKEKTDLNIEKVIDFMNMLPGLIERFESSGAFNNPKEREDWKTKIKFNIDNVINMIISFLDKQKNQLTIGDIGELSWRIKTLANAKGELDCDNRVAERIKEILCSSKEETYTPSLLEYIRSNFNFYGDRDKIFKEIIDGEKDIKKPSIFKNVKVEKETDSETCHSYPIVDKLKKDFKGTGKSNLTFKHLGKGLTLKEALKYSSPTRDSSKVKCKKCRGIYDKRHFYGHYKKHIS